jgi:hypothetical protein
MALIASSTVSVNPSPLGNPTVFGEGCEMSCKRCVADNLKDFNAELGIHFPGYQGLSKRLVFAYPKLTICTNCGFVEFELSEEGRRQLRDDDSSVQPSTRQLAIKSQYSG